ncbi:MAG: flagellin [bacterium]
MIVNTNLSALNSINAMGMHNNAISDSMKKLASGLKINSASDDPGSIGLTQEMRAKINSLNQAEQNCDYGISMLQIMDVGLSEIQNILQKMNELSLQAQNDTLSDNDRANLQIEIDSLASEIDNIAKNTTYNDMEVLQVEYENDVYTGIVNSIDISMGEFLYSEDGFSLNVSGMNDGSTVSFVQKEVNTSVYSLTNPTDLSGSISATYDVVSGNIVFEVYGGWEYTNDDGTSGSALVIDDEMLQEALSAALKEAKEGATNSQLVTINNIEMSTSGTLNALAGTADGLDFEPVYKAETSSSSITTTGGSSIDSFTIEGLDPSITSVLFTESDKVGSGIDVHVDENGVMTVSVYNTTGSDIDVSSISLQSYIQNATFDSEFNDGNAIDLSGVTVSFKESGGDLTIGDTTSSQQNFAVAQNKESGAVAGSESSGDSSGSGDTISSTTVIGSGGRTENLTIYAYKIDNISGAENIETISFKEVTDKSNFSDPSSDIYVEVDENGNMIIQIYTGEGTDLTSTALTRSSDMQTAIQNATIHESLQDSLDLSNATYISSATSSSSGINYAFSISPSNNGNGYGNELDGSYTKLPLPDPPAPDPEDDFDSITGPTFISIGDYEDLEIRSLSDTVVGMGQVSTNVGLQVGYTGDDFDPKYIQIYDVRSKTLDVNDLDLTSYEGAIDAQEKINTALDFISTVRTRYGAIQSRLEFTTDYLNSAVQFSEEYLSNIEDVDMAEELQNYSKAVLLSQSAQIMLAQSNVNQRDAWTLLYDLNYYY